MNSISAGTPALPRRASSPAQAFGKYSRYATDRLASCLACDSDTDTPAKLRSDEIDLFRMVGGDIMLAIESRDFGSEIFPTTSETLLSMVGILLANFTAFSIWNMALSNRIEPRSLFPERGRSMLLAAAAASNGWVQSC